MFSNCKNASLLEFFCWSVGYRRKERGGEERGDILLYSINTFDFDSIKLDGNQIKNMAHEPQVLRMCYQDMKERAILPKEINLEINTMESCNRYSGVEHAAYLHYLKNASVYFGPGCNNGNFCLQLLNFKRLNFKHS